MPASKSVTTSSTVRRPPGASTSQQRSTGRASSGSVMSRGGRLSTATSVAREEATRRANEYSHEVEGAIHVLDNGVNRTPAPLVHHRNGSVMGGKSHTSGGGGFPKDSLMTDGFAASTLQSSFLFSSEQHRSGGANGSRMSLFESSTNQQSMESSMQSLSMMDARHGGSSMQDHSSRQGSVVPNGAGGGPAVATLRPQQTLLEQCAVPDTASARMSEAERRNWAKERTTITLSETPTIFLYMHHDEAVSNESREEVRAVREDNEAYRRIEDAFRADEGTRFHAKGTSTLAAPKKSIHCDVQPPLLQDAGALQVTSWMLKGQFSPLLEDDADDEAEKGKGAGQEDEKDDADEELEAELDNGEVAEMEQSMSDQSSYRGASTTAGGGDGKTAGGGGAAQGSKAASNKWMFADSLLSNLRIMERAVVQNTMEDIQLAYRGIEMDSLCLRDAAAAALAGKSGAASALKTPASPSGMLDDAKREGVDGDGEDGAAAAGETGVVSRRRASVLGNLPAMTCGDDAQPLWTFRGPWTRGRTVTSMAWNKRVPDLLAVGYSARRSGEDLDAEDALLTTGTNGKTDGKGNASTAGADGLSRHRAHAKNGMVCCWSLKNPLAPELVLYLRDEVDVSSVAFSEEFPSLLAVGSTGGVIVVYDVQKDVCLPSITPSTTAGLHTGAVWELRWVPRGKERGEFLMSIAADGRVVQWVVGKSIERMAPDLMHLARQPGAQVEKAFVDGVAEADEAAGRRRRGGGVGREDAALSRQSGGMTFDVCPSDNAIYVVGTEEGGVFQCNKSQTESFDLDYQAHAELVYRIRWSPYSTHYFATCSADWTSRLYRVGRAAPVARYESPTEDAIEDIAWSYTNALHFATATAHGNVEVWSVVDAVYPLTSVQFNDHRRLTSVLFAEQENPVLVCGDQEGDVTVVSLLGSGFTRQHMTDDEQEHWLEEAVAQQLS